MSDIMDELNRMGRENVYRKEKAVSENFDRMMKGMGLSIVPKLRNEINISLVGEHSVGMKVGLAKDKDECVIIEFPSKKPVKE